MKPEVSDLRVWPGCPVLALLICMLLAPACFTAAPVHAAPFSIATGSASMNFAFDGTNYLVGVENHQTSPPDIGAQLIDVNGSKVGGLISTGFNGISANAAFDGTNYLLIWENDPGGTGTGLSDDQLAQPGERNYRQRGCHYRLQLCKRRNNRLV